MQKYWYFRLLVLFFLAGFLIESRFCLAQQIPDNTLGNENSVVTPDATVNDSPATLIEGGATRETNLFHSFSEFNVGNLEKVYFANPIGIDRIFSRITGSNISNIDGLLGVAGNADLFLINPNGIIFGENVSLDINGSFIGSTANNLVFGDEFVFSADNPNNVPDLLTVNIVPGLQYGSDPGAIQNFSVVGLQVPTGKTLALIGGDIELNGGVISAFDGEVELGSVGENSLVSVTTEDNGYIFNYDRVNSFQEINFKSASVNIVDLENSNNLKIIGKTIKLEESSAILTANLGNLLGGNIFLTASELIELEGGQIFSAIDIFSGEQSTGKSHDITIQTNDLLLKNGASIFSFTDTVGNAGNIEIIAQQIQLNGVSNIGSLTGENATGNAGKVDFTTDSLTLLGASFLDSSTLGQGNGNLLKIDAKKIKLMEESGISSRTFSSGNAGKVEIISKDIELVGTENIDGGNTKINADNLDTATGDAGDIFIQTDNLLIRDGGIIAIDRFGTGKSGNLSIEANRIEIRGESPNRPNSRQIGNASQISIKVADPEGEIGNIENDGSLAIQSEHLIVRDRGSISASTFGNTEGGDIEIEASKIELIGGTITSQVEPSAVGNAGDVEIITDFLQASKGGQISVSSFGMGTAGNLRINSQEIELIGKLNDGEFASGLFSRSNNTGNGGKLTITTEQLSISEEAEISASSLESGLAGNVEISTNEINLDNGAITTQTDAGDGGDITLQITDLLLLRNESEISTTAGQIEAGGDGGNISINSDVIVAFSQENSDITANAFNGSGGNINIETEGIFGIEFSDEQTSFSDITASSEFGLDGSVTIDTPDANPVESSINLPQDFAVPPLDNSCQGISAEESSSFVDLGRGGIPENPQQIRDNGRIWDDLRSPIIENNNKLNSNIKLNHNESIVEAQGWIVGANGNILLVANNNDLSAINYYALNCKQK